MLSGSVELSSSRRKCQIHRRHELFLLSLWKLYIMIDNIRAVDTMRGCILTGKSMCWLCVHGIGMGVADRLMFPNFVPTTVLTGMFGFIVGNYHFPCQAELFPAWSRVARFIGYSAVKSRHVKNHACHDSEKNMTNCLKRTKRHLTLLQDKQNTKKR